MTLYYTVTSYIGTADEAAFACLEHFAHVLTDTRTGDVSDGGSGVIVAGLVTSS